MFTDVELLFVGFKLDLAAEYSERWCVAFYAKLKIKSQLLSQPVCVGSNHGVRVEGESGEDLGSGS